MHELKYQTSQQEHPANCSYQSRQFLHVVTTATAAKGHGMVFVNHTSCSADRESAVQWWQWGQWWQWEQWWQCGTAVAVGTVVAVVTVVALGTVHLSTSARAAKQQCCHAAAAAQRAQRAAAQQHASSCVCVPA